VRWTQLGFGRTSSTSTTQDTPRNLQGFKDGTNNLKAEDGAVMRDHVWVGNRDEPVWMRGGSYVVTRRIRMLLETWDRSALSDQQDTIGREKVIVDELAEVHTGFRKIVISPTAIEQYYNQHLDKYQVEDKVKLRMIQIPESAGSKPGEARELAGEILHEINGGAPFAEMAMVNCTGSAVCTAWFEPDDATGAA